jgi:hypothetical protein
MANELTRLEAELRRLDHAPHPNEKPGGVGTVRFVARCPLAASDVLAKAISLLKTVDEVALGGWPAEERWAAKLPEWFTARCAPALTRDEAERRIAQRKTLPPDEQARVAQEADWSLAGWLYWMEPSHRQWFWWEARVSNDRTNLLVTIEVDGWPFPWGSLRWLFKAAGASDVEPEEDSGR